MNDDIFDKLSDADLEALASDNYDAMSDEGLMLLSGETPAAASPPVPTKQPSSTPMADNKGIVDRLLGGFMSPQQVVAQDPAKFQQSLGESAVELGNASVESAPEIGAAIGGTVGLAGGLVGSTLGAGVGGALGSIAQQKIQSPGTDVSAVKAVGEGAQAALIEGAGGLAFKGASIAFPQIKKVFMAGYERAAAKIAEESAAKATAFTRTRGGKFDVPIGSPLTKGLEEGSQQISEAAEIALDEVTKIVSNKGRESATQAVSEIVEAGNSALSSLYGDGLKKVGLDKFKVDTTVLQRQAEKQLADLQSKGVTTDNLYKNQEANTFVKKFFEETAGAGKVSADIFESRYISEAKQIQRQAKLQKNSDLANEMGDIIKGLEGAIEQSVKLQGGAKQFSELKALRQAYSDNINNLNLQVIRKLSDDPTKIYGFVKDSKSAAEFASALRTAQVLNPSKISVAQMKSAIDEAASVLIERKLPKSIDPTKGVKTVEDLLRVRNAFRALSGDREFMATLNKMGASKKASEVKELFNYTNTMADRLYKKKGFSEGTRQMATDAALVGTVGSAYALARLMFLSVPWIAKKASSMDSVLRWQRRLSSGELTVDAALKIAKQEVGQDFFEYLQNRED